MKARMCAQFLASTCLAMLLAGCIPIPLTARDDSGSRQNVADQVPTSIVAGDTTRADVLLALGEPDGTTEHGTQFTYTRVSRNSGMLFVFVGMGGGGAAVGVESKTYRRLMILFDEQGIVTSARIDRVSCTESSMAAGSGQAGSAPCADVKGLDQLFADPAGKGLAGQQIAAQVVAPADWYPGVGGFDAGTADGDSAVAAPVAGILVVADTRILLLRPDADSRSAPLLDVAYADVADIHVASQFWLKRLVVTRRNGASDSFMLKNGEAPDSKLTRKAGELARREWQAAIAH